MAFLPLLFPVALLLAFDKLSLYSNIIPTKRSFLTLPPSSTPPPSFLYQSSLFCTFWNISKGAIEGGKGTGGAHRMFLGKGLEVTYITSTHIPLAGFSLMDPTDLQGRLRNVI